MSNLVDVQIPSPNDPELSMGAGIMALAESIVVEDVETHDLAGAELVKINTAIGRLNERRMAITRPIDAAKKSVMDLFRGPIEKLDAAGNLLRGKMLAFQREERAKAAREAEELRRAQAEVQRVREAELLKEAQAAQAKGDHEEAQAKLEEAAAPPPPPPPTAAPPKAAGVTSKTVWKGVGEDLDKTIAAAAAGDKLARACLQFNDSVIGQQARSLKGACSIPGVRVWPDDQLSASRRG